MILFSSCATLFTGTRRNVQITSNVPNAEIIIKGEIQGRTPVTLYMERGKGNRTILLQKEGYTDGTYGVKAKFNGWFIGNLFSWGIFGMLIDLMSGAFVILETPVYIELQENKK